VSRGQSNPSDTGTDDTGGEKQNRQDSSQNTRNLSRQDPKSGPQRSSAADSDRAFGFSAAGSEQETDEKSAISRDGSRPAGTSDRQKPPGTRQSPRSGQPFLSAAWRRAAHTGSTRSYRLENGWHVLTMDLEEESGQMTVKARRSDEKVSVSVGMNDPKLRALVAANTDRLQAALNAEYETDVDFTLSGDDGQSARDNEKQADRRSSGRSLAGGGPADGDEEPPGPDVRVFYGNFEWIG
jgi:hypothetical protein